VTAALRRTPLDAAHRELGARMVPFAGWEMPLHYGSQLDEHRRTRSDASMFDVSHMRAVEIEGPDARPYLRRLLANDVAKLDAPGRALYSCMLNESGGVLDDLIAYALPDGRFRLVVNAATAETDLAWMRATLAAQRHACRILERTDLAIIAVQGPNARAKCLAACPAAAVAAHLHRFHAAGDASLWIARTGYTGEDGYEIMLPAEEAVSWWRALLAHEVAPAGLGARDTLRLEAGLDLYGQDMDEQVTPYECGLAWTVAVSDERDFIGKAALLAATPRWTLLGLVLEAPGIMRAHAVVTGAHGEGVVTSGGYAPTLDASIGLARLPRLSVAGERVEVEVRGRRLPARTVKPPFVRNGRALVIK
jgi:aminomethyltransferase